MPAIIKVKVIEGRDLPIMDRASDLTDAFVELRLGNTFYKTDVCRKSLNPQWDSDWFKFEVDDEELQQENLQVKVLDYDMYSSHDSIGKVSIYLDIFAAKGGSNEMSGLFPIYDTIHGIRGHLRLKIKVQFFMDTNKYRQTSCGVQLFSAACVPHGFVATHVQGLVEELLVNDDPEYQWIDKIRTPRASNEARQRLFSKLSGEVKRKVGIKVLELGGNAVIGYQQLFDLEGETGIIVRAIGTAVTLIRESDNINVLYVPPMQNFPSPEITSDASAPPTWRTQRSLDGTISDWRCRSSPCSDSDANKGVSFSECPDNTNNTKALPTLHKNLSRKEYEHDHPFFTFTTPPPGFIIHLGGVVSSRAVKLLDKINNPDDSETRDSWWNELRMELRSHAKAMGCQAVVGYSEYTSICDDLIVLSVYGTAAVIRSPESYEDNCSTSQDIYGNCISRHVSECEGDQNGGLVMRKISDDLSSNTSSVPPGGPMSYPSCHICHIPYSDVELPLPITFTRCAFCRMEKVPDVLFTTIDVPDELPITGSGCMIQARAIRCRKKEKGEADAENVSQILPFLEFDMHQQLLNKLKLKGMNGIFGLKAKLCIGEQVIIGIMTGTAVFIAALPPPPMLKVSSQNDCVDIESDKRLADIRNKLMEINKRNLQFHSVKESFEIDENCREKKISFSDANEIEVVKNEKLDFFADGKDTFVLEVDDTSDANILPLLSDTNYEGFNIFNTQATPGFPMLQHGHQYLSVFNRIKVPISVDDDLKTTHWISHVCDSLIMRLRLKTRMIRPCCLTKTSFDIDIDDDDNFQLTVSAFATKIDPRFNKPPKSRTYSRSLSSQSETSNDVEERGGIKQCPMLKCGGTKRNDFHESHSPVIICPADSVPNSQVLSYIGNISLFLIRESMSVKEDGGLDLFMQQFMCEIHAIIRSHVLALGGNAILSFSLNEIILYYNTHKNHASCLINLSGDAACIKGLTDISGNLICQTERTLSASSSIASSPITELPVDPIDENK